MGEYPNHAKDYWHGYKRACEDFGIWQNGAQYIGCLSRPVKDVLREKWTQLFPDCPLIDCPGCQNCEPRVNLREAPVA